MKEVYKKGDEKLGLQLQDLRIKKNMTQEMVAEYMNVSLSNDF